MATLDNDKTRPRSKTERSDMPTDFPAAEGTMWIDITGNSSAGTFIERHETSEDLPADVLGEAVAEMLMKIGRSGGDIMRSSVLLTFRKRPERVAE